MTKPVLIGNIDLPAPPFRTTTAELPLAEAEVTAYLMSNEALRGRLLALSAASGMISIRSDSQDHAITASHGERREGE